MAIRFDVNGEIFARKQDLVDRIRGIVAAYPDYEPLSGADLALMVALLRNHPHAASKFGCGVSTIHVQRNPVYRHQRCFMLVRNDGSSTDFSWWECLKKTSHRKKIASACREAILPYTNAFKRQFFSESGWRAQCPFTGEVMQDFLSAHVDHEPPMTFEVIFDNFLREHGLDVETIALKDELADNRYCDELADSETRAAWVAYHNRHAKLRVVSALANLSHVKRKPALVEEEATQR